MPRREKAGIILAKEEKSSKKRTYSRSHDTAFSPPKASGGVHEQSAPKPPHGIPAVEWPNVLRRVIENEEPLHQVAKDYGVSHETVRQLIVCV